MTGRCCNEEYLVMVDAIKDWRTNIECHVYWYTTGHEIFYLNREDSNLYVKYVFCNKKNVFVVYCI